MLVTAADLRRHQVAYTPSWSNYSGPTVCRAERWQSAALSEELITRPLYQIFCLVADLPFLADQPTQCLLVRRQERSDALMVDVGDDDLPNLRVDLSENAV